MYHQPCGKKIHGYRIIVHNIDCQCCRAYFDLKGLPSDAWGHEGPAQPSLPLLLMLSGDACSGEDGTASLSV